MQLDKLETFENKDLFKFAMNEFKHFFKDDVTLVDSMFINNSMGYFCITYRLLKKNYLIKFEYDRNYFSIRITRSKEEFVSINQMYPNRMKEKNAGSKSNIREAIMLLHKSIVNDDIFFYKVKKNKLVRVIDNENK